MRAFSLLEILTVEAIIFVLLTITLWTATSMRRTTRNKAAAAELSSLQSAIERYHETYGDWPDRRLPDPLGSLKNKEIVRLLRNWRIDRPFSDASGKDTHFKRDPMLEKLAAAQLDSDGNWRDPWGSPYAISILPDEVWTIYQRQATSPARSLSSTEAATIAPYGSSQDQIQYWVKTVRGQLNLYSLGVDKISQNGKNDSDDVRP